MAKEIVKGKSKNKIEQLPSGMYRARIMIDGKRHSITRATKREVEFEIASIMTGRTGAVSSETLEKLCNEFIDLRRNTLSPATIRGYVTIVNTRFQKLMDKRISSITDKQWQAAIDNEATLCSPKSLRNAWGFVSTVLRTNNRMPPKVTLPAPEKNTREILQPEQMPVFLAAIEGKPVEIAALLGLHSLRFSEILALEWSNIDLNDGDLGVIHVKGAVVPNDENELVHKNANKVLASTRDIPILIPQLRAALERRKEEGAPKPVTTVSNTSTNACLERVCKAAGLPRLTCHCMRHSFASLCLHLGVNEVTCMKLGGWSDRATMTKIYQHAAEVDRLQGIKDLSNFFKTAGTEETAKDENADSTETPEEIE